ncbi:unnamed protein product [Polarella glacialis]|uniref:Uncharacterized protein n=1 Tax=Polarella glacialis TaxID=89957 RepID=A0A813DCP5_POLGL|nr:unnamed protein product [Polarella glacialis]CAE8675916.1 unnamed protein product [Polarella glacialis]
MVPACEEIDVETIQALMTDSSDGGEEHTSLQTFVRRQKVVVVPVCACALLLLCGLAARLSSSSPNVGKQSRFDLLGLQGLSEVQAINYTIYESGQKVGPGSAPDVAAFTKIIATYKEVMDLDFTIKDAVTGEIVPASGVEVGKNYDLLGFFVANQPITVNIYMVGAKQPITKTVASVADLKQMIVVYKETMSCTFTIKDTSGNVVDESNLKEGIVYNLYGDL